MVLTGPVIRRRLALCMAVFFILLSALSGRLFWLQVIQGRALQRRRLDFYLRNGFRYAGYDCALFGVHYETLIRGAGDVSAQELLAVHQSMYQKQIPPQYYERFIQLPLAPGEQPWPAVEWKEE